MLITLASIADPSKAPIDEGHAAELATSIGEIGVLNPVNVLPKNGDGKYRLVAGRHRIAALKSLGVRHVEATVVELDELGAELATIDENLRRRRLSPLEESMALGRRKQLWEQLHPATKPKRGRPKKVAAVVGAEEKAYRDVKGRLLVVSSGISGGAQWMTCQRKPGGGHKRITSPALPLRDTRAEAQADLDAYAAKMGWQSVEADGEPAVKSFAEATAEQTGRSRRSVERDAALGERIDLQAADSLRKASHPIVRNKSELAKLAELPAKRQREVALELARGKLQRVPAVETSKAERRTSNIEGKKKQSKAKRKVEKTEDGGGFQPHAKRIEEELQELLSAAPEWLPVAIAWAESLPDRLRG